MKRTNWLFGLLLLAAILAFALPGCRVAQASDDPRLPTLMVLPAVQGDTSVALVLAWLPPVVGGRRGQIDYYDTRLVGAAEDTVDAGVTTQSPDTLYAPLVVNDTLRVKGCVRAVDVFGQEGPFACSSLLSIFVSAQPPLPPDSVVLDTLPWPQLTRIDVAPDDIDLAEGFGVQVYTATLYDGLDRPLACSQALFQEGATSTEAIIVSDGVCTNVTLVPVDSVTGLSGSWVATPFLVANAVDWSSAIIGGSTYRINVLFDSDNLVLGMFDRPPHDYWYVEVEEE